MLVESLKRRLMKQRLQRRKRIHLKGRSSCIALDPHAYQEKRLRKRQDEVGDSFEEYIVYHRKFLTWMEVNGMDIHKRYSQEEIDQLVARSPYYKATANDVDWLMKVKMQGAIQKWVDHSISVTVNLPNEVDEALVNRLYVEAWRSSASGR